MDGSEINLGLLSGSNTTVEQLHKEIIMVAYFKLIQNKPGLNFYMQNANAIRLSYLIFSNINDFTAKIIGKGR